MRSNRNNVRVTAGGELMKSFKLLMAVAVTLSFAAVSRGADSASISGKITFDGTPP
jgi:hypothetical protein